MRPSLSGQPNVMFNILGGCLTLVSLQLPWLTTNGFYGFSVQPGPMFPVAFYWLLAGAVLSFLSRYAGSLTAIGILAFLGQPFASYGSANTGLGTMLAITGMLFTFAGERWSVPENIARGREILGGALYTIGFLTLLTTTVSIFLYRSVFSALEGDLIVRVPLMLAGAFLTIQGMRIYFSPRRTEISVLKE